MTIFGKKELLSNLIMCVLISRIQLKSWPGKALETVNCAFLKRRLIGAH
jgi:hypothetical protein